MELKSAVPQGPVEQKWEKHRFDLKLVNPQAEMVIAAPPRAAIAAARANAAAMKKGSGIEDPRFREDSQSSAIG